MAFTSDAVVVPLEKAHDPRFGGKAHGLAKLMKLGLTVPNGFVVSADGDFSASDEIERAFSDLGAPRAAVRSSATCEDNIGASAAGQFETILGVDSLDNLQHALARCFASFESANVGEYLKQMGTGAQSGHGMSVIVQTMVDSDVSGVIFTSDPMNKNKDTVLVEACSGLGEQLVSGQVQASQYRFNRHTFQIEDHGDQPVLSDGRVRALVEEALTAEAFFGHPLDLEWSIDKHGTIHWLQARPITTTDLPAPDEFDYEPTALIPYFTRANVGEMMPGAATPLTISVFAVAVDKAMHSLYRASGAITKETRDEQFICTFSNHLFFNLSMVYEIVGRVAGTSPEALEVSLLGRKMDERPHVHMKNALLRLFNLGRYSYHVLTHKRAIKKLERILDQSFTPDQSSAAALYQNIDTYIAIYFKAMSLHMQVSAFSGALNGALRTTLEKAGLDRQKQLEVIGALLSHIEGIESAEIIQALEMIAGELRVAREREDLSPESLEQWLQDTQRSGPIGGLFQQFVENHGHRCVREVELREKPWSDDLSEVIHTLWLMSDDVKSEHSPGDYDGPQIIDRLVSEHPKLSKGALSKITELARGGVRKREYTKAIIIKISSHIRFAYRTLATLLVSRDILPDEDLVFFLTHQELGLLCTGNPNPQMVTKAHHRRRHYPAQMELRFPDFCKGIPCPTEAPTQRFESGSIHHGMAVSPGTARGKVRVVLSKADAQSLESGEIMVARFTDVGWTPYYGIAAGLITEIGSSLSHGAVVAREYGLPLVSNIENVTLLLKTGDAIEMNGTTGEIRLLS
jgi:pyruvate,water dikinase